MSSFADQVDADDIEQHARGVIRRRASMREAKERVERHLRWLQTVPAATIDVETLADLISYLRERAAVIDDYMQRTDSYEPAPTVT